MEENKTLLKEIKRHMNVLMEELGGQVKLIAEQHTSVIEKLNSHDKRFDKIEDRLDSHTGMIASIKEDTEIMKIDVKTNKENIGILKEDVEVVKKDVKTNKENIKDVKKDVGFIKDSLEQKANAEDFEVLNKKMFLLEAKAQ